MDMSTSELPMYYALGCTLVEEDEPETLTKMRAGVLKGGSAAGRMAETERPVSYSLGCQLVEKDETDTWIREGGRALERSVREVLSAILPTADSLFNRKQALDEFSGFVHRYYPDAKVEPFGSYVMDLSRLTGDLDISVGFPSDPSETTMSKRKKVSVLRKLEAAARNYPDVVTKLTPIYHANIPVLQFHDAVRNVTLDVGVANFDGIFKSNFVKFITRIDARFRPLCFLLKSWARHHAINDAKFGTLNTFSLYNLMAVHLQTEEPAILPPYADILCGEKWSSTADGRRVLDACEGRAQQFADRRYGAANKDTVAELFIRFFHKMVSKSEGADQWSQGLCASPRLGRWTMKQSNYAIYVEDFLSPETNTARAVQRGTLSKRIVPAFRKTLATLKTSNPDHTMFLLLGPDAPRLAQRVIPPSAPPATTDGLLQMPSRNPNVPALSVHLKTLKIDANQAPPQGPPIAGSSPAGGGGSFQKQTNVRAGSSTFAGAQPESANPRPNPPPKKKRPPRQVIVATTGAGPPSPPSPLLHQKNGQSIATPTRPTTSTHVDKKPRPKTVSGRVEGPRENGNGVEVAQPLSENRSPGQGDGNGLRPKRAGRRRPKNNNPAAPKP